MKFRAPIPNPTNSQWRNVLNEVAREMDIDPSAILSRSQRVPITAARHEAMRRVIRSVRLSGKPPTLSAVGRWFDRDHSCVYWALRGGRRETAIK